MKINEYAKEVLPQETYEQLRKEYSEALEGDWAVPLLYIAASPEFRAKHQIPFIQKIAPVGSRVFDSCLGQGSSAIALQDAGYQVVANEYETALRNTALASMWDRFTDENDPDDPKRIKVYAYDWRELSQKNVGTFDAVTCLGNSLTYLMGNNDELESLKCFKEILKPGGKLLIDQRNYDAILEGRNPQAGLVYDYTKYAVTFPWIAKDKTAVILKAEAHKTPIVGFLLLYPFHGTELEDMVAEVFGKRPDVYYDHIPQEQAGRREDAEFITYVASK